MSSSNCCFLTCIQISQEASQVVWYSHLLKNFPQFVVSYTGKVFGIINKAEIDVFLEFSCLFYDPTDVGNLICGSSVQFSSVAQSCLTLCDPIDGSPPGSTVPGILQARMLEWSAISFSNAWKWKVKVKSLSHVWLSTVDPMDCSLPGSSIHGIFQARVLEWGAIAFSPAVATHSCIS